MLSSFMIRWYPNQVLNVQYGLGSVAGSAASLARRSAVPRRSTRPNSPPTASTSRRRCSPTR
ncbi:hypothetical protein ACFSTI_15155 [Rhizorhabdus histidinilytica]